MNARRLELYELLKPKLDEAPARALVLALPDDPEQLVTKDDLAAGLSGLEARLTARIDALAAHMDSRFAQVDGRFAQVDGRFAQVDGRFGQQDSVLTRRMITIMGAWTILLASTMGWVTVLLR